MQNILAYEKEAKKIEFQIEEDENIGFDRTIDCKTFKKNYANCKYALYLYETTS